MAAARGDGVDDLAPSERAFRWAIEWARDQGCGLVQLTTDATRRDAHRFYARLGFEPTHLGFKLPLEG